MDLKLRRMPPDADNEELDGAADREEREKIIKDLYERLQTLFPGVDPAKEPTMPAAPKTGGPNPGTEGMGPQRMASIGAQMQGSSAPSPASSVNQTTPQVATVSEPPSISS